MKTVPHAMFVLTRNRIPISRTAYSMREISEALLYAQFHDLAHKAEYGFRRIAVWIPKGVKPSIVGIAGRKWQYDEHRKVVR